MGVRAEDSIDDVGHELAEGHHGDVGGHEGASQVGWGALGQVHGDGSRRQACTNVQKDH